MRTEFSTLDIGRALVIPRERLRDWMSRGYVAPSVPAAGQGTKAIFTRDDAYNIELFRNMIDHGFSREVAGKFLKDFTDRLKKEKDGSIYPENIYIVFRSPGREGKEISDVSLLGPGAWKFDIESGYIDWKLSNPKFNIKTRKQALNLPPIWRNIHIVNFGTLRKEVDAALVKL
jgi:hypothetical protein